MKKITSVFLALILVLGLFALTGCTEQLKDLLPGTSTVQEEKPEDLLAAASMDLAQKPYSMTMKMNFSSDNQEMNEVFKMMNMEIPVTIDGDNLSMDMSMDMMGDTMTTKMILVDKVLYYDMEIYGMSQKMKATLSDQQFQEFMGEQTVGMPVDYSQFAVLKAEKKDGKTVINCEGITDAGKKALNDQMAASLAAMGGSASIGDFTYTITLKDGKYESMDLSCTYTVSVAGQSVSVTMIMGAVISYDNVPAITVPADADSYTLIDYSELMGG